MNKSLVFLALSLGLTAAAVLASGWHKQAERRRAHDCEATLRNVGLALEHYSTDNYGRYPRTNDKCWEPDDRVPLQKLDRYLYEVPACDYQLSTAVSPDLYTVVCTGHRCAYTCVEGYVRDCR